MQQGIFREPPVKRESPPENREAPYGGKVLWCQPQHRPFHAEFDGGFRSLHIQPLAREI
jgi:hypothetical protein